MKLKPCPKCDSDDLHLDSSSAAEASWIECNDCEYRFQKRCDEETLIERWNKLRRRKSALAESCLADKEGGKNESN